MSRAVPTPVSRVRRVAALGTLLGALLLALGCLPAQAAGPKRASFDHLTTGFELIGQHRDLPCESCHANAIFKGTPKECKACHGVGTAIRATAKPATHILATDECGACHTPIAFKPAVNFDHTQARGGCSTCHNGVVATGKPPNHIVTDLECDACHTTLSWAGAVFTHQGVTGNCASCHNGVQATGMPGNHIPSGSVACEACHSPTDFTTFAGAQINHPAVAALSCASCHETAAYLGMKPSTATSAADSRPPVQLDANHPRTGDCGQCHDTATFAGNVVRPANHIPTSAPCAQCHTTPGNYALYSVTGTHQGVTNCLSCHGPTVATTFANITITTTPGNHIPIGALDCSGSGCHGTANVSTGGFRLGTASINAPTLTVAGHATVAGAVSACQTCHESAPYLGMMPSTGAAAGDSRPSSVLDAAHPATGDCTGCHSTTPTFALNVTGGAKPANHIPTNAPCAQCHTNPGNYAVYSVTGTHQGVTNCLSCHGPTVATTFANITITSTPGNHIPIGALDCSGSGCHSTANVNTGGFKIGTANISTPTLTVAGHTTVAGAVASCQTCHEAAPYLGMLASTATTAADSRPSAALDATHPTTGDCGGCHVTSPTFASNVVAGTKPANHIPTNAPCAQCHTTPGNFAAYSVTGTHQGVTACLSCHAPSVATTFANITIVTTPSNHMPIGSLDCNGSGCHTITNVNAGGFRLGAASINAPDPHRDRPHDGGGSSSQLSDLPSKRPLRGHDREQQHDRRRFAAVGHAGCRAPRQRRLQRLPHYDACVRHQSDRRQRQTRQPHPDERAVRAMPHQRRQLRGVFGHRHPPGHHWLSHLPRTGGGRNVCQHQDRNDAEQPHPDWQSRLQRLGLPHDRQRQCRRVQDRIGKHQHSDADGSRSHHGGRRGHDLPNVPPERCLRRHDRQYRDRRG